MADIEVAIAGPRLDLLTLDKATNAPAPARCSAWKSRSTPAAAANREWQHKDPAPGKKLSGRRHRPARRGVGWESIPEKPGGPARGRKA
jgi:hypothetical protein